MFADMARGVAGDLENEPGWQMEVSDESGKPIFRLSVLCGIAEVRGPLWAARPSSSNRHRAPGSQLKLTAMLSCPPCRPFLHSELL